MLRILAALAMTLASTLSSSILQDRLSKASTGDYLVVEGGKMVSVLSIRAVSAESIVIEEISAPSQLLQKKPASWSEWIRDKAPGHTSWSMTEIDRQNGEILECYSFTRASWLEISPQESLLATLIKLPLTPIAEENRRRIGPPPAPGELDHRKIWNPPALCEGKKQEKIEFDVFQTQWPSDGSPLEGTDVLFYFDRAGKFPLPFWMEFQTSHLHVSLRTIDSGRQLPSPYKKFPRRVPQILGDAHPGKNGIKILFKSPKYYRGFDLFAVEATSKEKILHPIPHFTLSTQGEIKIIEISQEELEKILEPGHRYTWLLAPWGQTDSYTENRKFFVWTPRSSLNR